MKLFFGTILDNENESYKAIMQKEFVEKIEFYYPHVCHAITHDEDYIYIAHADRAVNKVSKSNFEIVGTYYADGNIGSITSEMKGHIVSDADFIYILVRSISSSNVRKVVKIDKETMNEVVESIYYTDVRGYDIDDEHVYLVTGDNSIGTLILSKNDLMEVRRLTTGIGIDVAVDSDYIYLTSSPKQIVAFNKVTYLRTLINFDSLEGNLLRIVVHNNNLYYLTSTRLYRVDTSPPFNLLVEIPLRTSIYFDIDAIYSVYTDRIMKINPDTLLVEEQKRCVLDDSINYLLKEEGKERFYYFHESDRNNLRSLEKGYKLIGYERVD